jgi:hypothetical protein
MAKQTETREALNARVLATVTVHPHVIANMKAIMTKPWPKLAGPMPTDQQLMAGAAYAKATAAKEAMFVTLQLRDEGCSVLQLGQACGAGPAHNHSRDHSGRVWHNFNRGKLGVGTYTLTFTPKGEKWLTEYLAKLAAGQAEGAAVATPKAKKATKAVVKAKGKAKAKKATVVAPAETPTSEPVTVTEGQPVTVDAELNQQPAVDVTVDVGGVDADHDAVTGADLQALAAHFNQS